MSTFFRAIAFGLCAAAVPAALHAAGADADPAVPFVLVTGSAQGEAAFDRAIVPFSIVSEAPTSDEVSRALAEKSKAIVDALGQIGVAEPNLRINGPILSIVYNNVTDTQGRRTVEKAVAAGIRGEVGFRVTVTDFKKIPKIFQTASSSGALLSNPIFELANLEEERAKLGAEAVRSALTRAKRLAEAAGGRPGRVLSVVEDRAGRMPFEQPMARAMAAAPDAAPDMPVMPGRAKLEQTVTLRVEILTK